MAKQFDWQHTDDPRDVIHMAVQAVTEGHIVAVPGDCSYLLVGSGLKQNAISKLSQIASKDPHSHGLTLMLRHAKELLDYFPNLPPSLQRFATKVWPGPLTLEIEDSHDSSLFRCIPAEVTELIRQPNRKFRVSLPSHAIFQQMSRLLVGPLVAAPAISTSGKLAREAYEVLGDSHSILINDGETSEIGLPTLVEFENNLATVTREGIVAKEYLKGLSRVTFLFVCTGNTCRSPMAQAMMNLKIKQKFADHFPNGSIPIVAYSAGVAAYSGDPASNGAKQAIQKYGTDLENHGSCQLSQEMADQADIILTMGSRHRQVIASQWPQVASKVHLISPQGGEISDPFGGPLEAYEKCASQLDAHTDYWIDQIKLSEIIRWNDPNA